MVGIVIRMIARGSFILAVAIVLVEIRFRLHVNSFTIAQVPNMFPA